MDDELKQTLTAMEHRLIEAMRGMQTELLRGFELVVYEGEGHHFNRPENRMDQVRRTIEWFRQYLK